MAKPRVSLAALAGPAAQAKVPAFVKAAPARAVRTTEIAFNPLNKRVVTTDDAEEMGASLTNHGQLGACAVVTRDAFLRIFPEHEDKIGRAGFVQVTGARRLAGSRHAKRPSLEVQVKDELAADRLTFLGATAAENLDRKDLNAIEEAHAIEVMLAEPGVQQNHVAEKLGRSAAWVTQRKNLLNLLPELQALVLSGTLLIEAARTIGRLEQDQQQAAYEQWTAAQQAKKTAPAPQPAPEPEPADKPDDAKPDDPDAQAAAEHRRVVTAVRNLGGTGRDIATRLTEVLPDPELRILYDTLHARFAA